MQAAAPKRWRGFDGKPTEMDTPYTLRAKELRDIYNSINMKYLTQDERLDVLLTLKHTVKVSQPAAIIQASNWILASCRPVTQDHLRMNKC